MNLDTKKEIEHGVYHVDAPLAEDLKYCQVSFVRFVITGGIYSGKWHVGNNVCFDGICEIEDVKMNHLDMTLNKDCSKLLIYHRYQEDEKAWTSKVRSLLKGVKDVKAFQAKMFPYLILDTDSYFNHYLTLVLWKYNVKQFVLEVVAKTEVIEHPLWERQLCHAICKFIK